MLLALMRGRRQLGSPIQGIIGRRVDKYQPSAIALARTQCFSVGSGDDALRDNRWTPSVFVGAGMAQWPRCYSDGRGGTSDPHRRTVDRSQCWLSTSASGDGQQEEPTEAPVVASELLIYRGRWVQPLRLCLRLKLLQAAGALAVANLLFVDPQVFTLRIMSCSLPGYAY